LVPPNVGDYFSGQLSKDECKIHEDQLSWMVFIIAKVSDALDGELLCRCFQPSDAITELGPHSVLIDVAVLIFFRHFRL